MAKKLTAAGVERVKAAPPGKRIEHFDAALPGFALRVTDKGRKSWVVFYRHAGKLRRMTLGGYPALDLVDAREEARKALRRVAKGYDPASERAELKAEEPDLFNAVADDFMERYAKKRTRSWAETDRIFKVYVKPEWGKRRIDSITRRDVIELLDKVEARGPVMANRTLAAIRKLFGWCVERDILTATPVANIKAPGKETERDRVLDDDEVKALWQGCEQLGWPFGNFAQLLLLTGQRRAEVASMRWPQIDLDKKTWIIPREGTKSDREHEVPLSDLAVAVLKSLPRIKDQDHVLGTGRRGDKPLSGYAGGKRKLDKASGVTSWGYHDLRRTCASGMARLNIAPHVVEKILNHSNGVISGVAAIYNRYDYGGEKRAALEAWSRYVDGLLTGEADNVVSIRD